MVVVVEQDDSVVAHHCLPHYRDKADPRKSTKITRNKSDFKRMCISVLSTGSHMRHAQVSSEPLTDLQGNKHQLHALWSEVILGYQSMIRKLRFRKYLGVRSLACGQSSFPCGAAVAQRIERSPPTHAKQARSLAGLLPDFGTRESCLTMPLVGAGFLGDLPFSLTLPSSVVPYPPRFALIGSQGLVVKSRPNLSNPSFPSCYVVALKFNPFLLGLIVSYWMSILQACSKFNPRIFQFSSYLSHRALDGPLTRLARILDVVDSILLDVPWLIYFKSRELAKW
ncbi:hypothetical protein PR048_024464 [Dryococelus australis]|uniref:Uncharacterized protein n=1 Tax=Dryococelus australis TaxID=614101 RepID=A0ABQ9GNN5_9NEOP|nr:hypothetical protein PR048_024464 [Dryococelus australis]